MKSFSQFKSKNKQREQIKADVAAFLASGGAIKVFDTQGKLIGTKTEVNGELSANSGAGDIVEIFENKTADRRVTITECPGCTDCYRGGVNGYVAHFATEGVSRERHYLQRSDYRRPARAFLKMGNNQLVLKTGETEDA